MRSAVVVLVVGAISMCLGCAAEVRDEGDLPSHHEASPSDAAGGFVAAPSGRHSRAEALYTTDAYRHHHDPGQGKPGDVDAAIGVATAADITWGPTPHGILADERLEEEALAR